MSIPNPPITSFDINNAQAIVTYMLQGIPPELCVTLNSVRLAQLVPNSEGHWHHTLKADTSGQISKAHVEDSIETLVLATKSLKFKFAVNTLATVTDLNNNTVNVSFFILRQKNSAILVRHHFRTI